MLLLTQIFKSIHLANLQHWFWKRSSSNLHNDQILQRKTFHPSKTILSPTKKEQSFIKFRIQISKSTDPTNPNDQPQKYPPPHLQNPQFSFHRPKIILIPQPSPHLSKTDPRHDKPEESDRIVQNRNWAGRAYVGMPCPFDQSRIRLIQVGVSWCCSPEPWPIIHDHGRSDVTETPYYDIQHGFIYYSYEKPFKNGRPMHWFRLSMK